MYSSQNRNIIVAVLNDKRTVFTFKEIALLVGEYDYISLNKKLSYQVGKGRLGRPHKGIYVKSGYNPEELSCVLYTPTYISLEYVLQRSGIIFQYDNRITAVSYLNRSIDIESTTYAYRKVKGEILVATDGIIRNDNINIATPERAFLDILYLNKVYHFDNINPLNRSLIANLLPIYNSKKLTMRVNKILKNG